MSEPLKRPVGITGYAAKTSAMGPEPGEAEEAIRFLLDGLGCSTIAEAKRLVDAGRAHADDVVGILVDATAEHIAHEVDGVLESIVRGDLEATETTRHLAQAELDHRRQKGTR